MDYPVSVPGVGLVGGKFVDEDQGVGQIGSLIPAAWGNAVTDEILAAIAGAGLTADEEDNTQLATAIQLGTLGAAVAGGTADAITATFSPTISALVDGMTLCVRAAGANATTTPTFSPDGIAARPIIKGAGAALVEGDIAGAGHWVVLRYDQTLDVWVLQNPAPRSTGYMLVQDQKASGTNGGSSVAGVQQRALNTVVANTIAGASLSANQVTLPAGTYRVRGYALNAAGVTSQTWLKNVTDNAIVALGNSSGGYNVTVFPAMASEFSGRIVLTSAKVFDIQHYSSAAVATVGLGRASGSGNAELFASLEIIKEA